MADKDIQIKLDLLINNADAASSVKEVRGAIKDLQSALINLDEGSEEFIRASKKAGELQDKVADVKDSIKSFNNSPIENVTNSFSLLGQKIKNLDFKGAKQQFTNLVSSTNTLVKSFLGIQEGAGFASISMKGLGKAFAATGIGLFVIAVIAVIANFDKLKASGGLLGSALKGLGDIVQSVVKFFTDLTDAIGLTAIASQKATDQMVADNQRLIDSKKASASLNKLYSDNAVKLAEAEGKSIEEVNALRVKGAEQALKDAQDLLALEDGKAQKRVDIAKKTGLAVQVLTKEEKEKEKADRNAAYVAEVNADSDLAVLKAKIKTDASKKASDDAKKASEESKKLTDKQIDEQKKALQKQIQDLKDSNSLKVKQQVDGSLEEEKAVEEGNLKIIEFYTKNKDKLISLGVVTETQRKLIIQEANDDILKTNKAFYDEQDKQFKEAEDKKIADAKDAAEKIAAAQAKSDDESKQRFIAAQQEFDDVTELKILKAGKDEQKIAAIQIDAEQEKIDRFKAYGAFELQQLGLTETQRQIIIAQSENNITDIKEEQKNKRITFVQEELAAITKQFQDTAAIIGGVGGAVLNGLGNITNSVSTAIKTFSDENATLGDKINAGLEIANQTVGAIGDALAAKSNERIAAVQTEKEQQIAALEEQNKRGLISDEQLAKGKDKINQDAYKKDLALRRKAFQQQKAIQIVQAVIGTAQGVVAALANPFPLNIAMAALAGVTGAINIGLIAAQKFPEGGSAPSSSTPSTPSASAEGLVNATSPNQFVPPQFQSIGDNRFSKGGEGNMFVLVDDINRGQRKVSVIEDRSTVL